MTSLTVPRRAGRRGTRVLAWVLGLGVLGALASWVVSHPAALESAREPVAAATPVGEPVFVGVYTLPSDSDRTLRVSGVRVFASSTVEVTVVPHVCKGGGVRVTTDPLSFCREVVPTEGATLAAGDEVLLEVSADAPGSVDLDRVRIAYRDGFRWATQDAGSPATVQILAR